MGVCSACGKEWPDEFKMCPDDGATILSKTREIGDLVGSIIADRYLVKRKLGEGGMGAVYLAEHVRISQKVAIKVISRQLAGDPDAVARFTREAQNAAQIKHPNVCSVHDFGQTPDGLVYLAMEFVEGRSLADLLRSQGALSPELAADILTQSCAGLEAAHDLGIVHRDIKPDNIMMAAQKDGSVMVKVVDFGLAKAATAEGQTITKTGFVVGTPDYMSPEQVSGEHVDGRSDVYSLGLVLFRMLTGQLPFVAETPQGALLARVTGAPLKLSEAVPDAGLPDPLQAVLDRALARDRNERFAEAREFARALTAVVRPGGHVTAEAALETEVLTTPMAVEAPRAGSLAPTIRTTPTPETPQPASGPSGRGRRPKQVAIAATVGVIAIAGAVAIGNLVRQSKGDDAGADLGAPAVQAVDSGGGAPMAADTEPGTVPSEREQPVTVSTADTSSTAATSTDPAATDSSVASMPVPAAPGTWTEFRQRLTTAELEGVWGVGGRVWAVGASGTLLEWDGSEWGHAIAPEQTLVEGTRLGTTGLDAVWGTGPNDVWAVGSIGTILHYDGTQWSDATPELTRSRLRSVWGSSTSDVWGVGDRGTILHYDGTAWADMGADTDDDFYGVWGAGSNDVWAAGEGVIFHYLGDRWMPVDPGTDVTWLYGVWGSGANDVWAVGEGGLILRYDGTQWSNVTPLKRTTSGDIVPQHNWLLSGIWGTGPNDIWIASNYTILHYNGAEWVDVTPQGGLRLNAIWTDGRGNGWAVGYWGALMRLSR